MYMYADLEFAPRQVHGRYFHSNCQHIMTNTATFTLKLNKTLLLNASMWIQWISYVGMLLTHTISLKLPNAMTKFLAFYIQ